MLTRAILLLFAGSLATQVRAADDLPHLPEGDNGIAAHYGGDAGIEGDSAVIYADDFESYSDPAGLSKRWDDVHRAAQVHLARDESDVFLGEQSLELRIPQRDSPMANAVLRELPEKCDVLFLRYYSKYDASFDVVGSSHNGAAISGGYYVDGKATPGMAADGKNKFLIGYESWRGKSESNPPQPPGRLNVYIYHPEQRSRFGDHFFPTGKVLPNSRNKFDFGPKFVARSDVVPDLGRWHCYEVMLQANTPGQRDGRVACWFEGKLIADFPNLRFRDVASLKIDRFKLGLHIGRNTAGATKKWYDNVVAATSYIGPVTREE